MMLWLIVGLLVGLLVGIFCTWYCLNKRNTSLLKKCLKINREADKTIDEYQNKLTEFLEKYGDMNDE